MPTAITENIKSAGLDKQAVSSCAINLVPTFKLHQSKFSSQHHINPPHHRSNSYSYIFHTRGSFHQAHVKGWQLRIKRLKIKTDSMWYNTVLKQNFRELLKGQQDPGHHSIHWSTGKVAPPQAYSNILSTCGSKLRSHEKKRTPYFPVIPGIWLSFIPYHNA